MEAQVVELEARASAAEAAEAAARAARDAAAKAGWCGLSPVRHRLSRPQVHHAQFPRLKLKHDGTAFKHCFQSQIAPLHQGGD